MAGKGPILQGYWDCLADTTSKERYIENLELINRKDPYEMPREWWEDNVDSWPSITYVNVGMYIVLAILNKRVHRGGSNDLHVQKPRLLSKIYSWMDERDTGLICER